MEENFQKPFDNMKDISVGVNEEILKIIDQIASITKSNRTIIIGALIGQGMSPFIKYLENTWTDLLDQKDLKKEKKIKIKILLQNLKNIEIHKWNPYA